MAMVMSVPMGMGMPMAVRVVLPVRMVLPVLVPMSGGVAVRRSRHDARGLTF